MQERRLGISAVSTIGFKLIIQSHIMSSVDPLYGEINRK